MHQFQICVTRKIPGKGLNRLKEFFKSLKILDAKPSQKELLFHIRNCDGILTMLSDRITSEVIDAAGPNLRVISNYAVGVNNIDVAYATQKGIIVAHTPGVLTESTADLAWTLLLATARRLVESDHLVRSGQWKGWAPTFMLGIDVHHKILGIIGLGRIGLAVAKRALAFDMKVIYYSRTRKPEIEAQYQIEYRNLEELLIESDFISIHVPLTPETRGMINFDQFQMMKSDAIIINTARGPVIDEKALIIALKKTQIRGAGLDVYQQEPTKNRELFEFSNVVLTPHLGSATIETRTKMADLAVDNLINALTQNYEPIKIVNPIVLNKL